MAGWFGRGGARNARGFRTGNLESYHAPRRRRRCGQLHRTRYITLLTAALCVSVAAANPPATQPAPSPGTVLVDSAGTIEEIVLHYLPDFAVELAPLYTDLFEALPVEVRIQVICPNTDAVAEFESEWGDAECRRGRHVQVIDVDRPITVWARDRRIARHMPFSDKPAATLVPNACEEYGDDHRNDLLTSFLLEQQGVAGPCLDTLLHIEGGNVVANDRHVFVGANVFEENDLQGLSGAHVNRELLRVLGRPFVAVGDERQRVPWSHVDMYLTPVDNETILLGSSAVAYMLLANHPEALAPLCDLIDDDTTLQQLANRGHLLDSVAEQLGTYSYDVYRLPVLIDPHEDWMVTYNNVLLEERDGRRVVYLPVYEIPLLDQAAEAVYRGLGFDVHPINVSGIFEHGGTVRCIANVIARRTQPRVTCAAPACEPMPAAPPAAPTHPSDTTAADTALATGSAQATAGAVDTPRIELFGHEFPIALAWLPLFIFLARILDVSVGTVRLICVARGRQYSAVILALAEITIWLLAMMSVLTYLTNAWNILAYIAGYTVGNLLGMSLERRLALGVETILLISREKGAEIAARLREQELRLTTIRGGGRDGEVELCLVVVPRRRSAAVIAMARAIDPFVFVTVEDVRHTTVGSCGSPEPGKRTLGLSALTHLWRMRKRAAGLNGNAAAAAYAPAAAAYAAVAEAYAQNTETDPPATETFAPNAESYPPVVESYAPGAEYDSPPAETYPPAAAAYTPVTETFAPAAQTYTPAGPDLHVASGPGDASEQAA